MELEEQCKTIAAEMSEAEAALAEALPALEAARLALSQLDVAELRLRTRVHDTYDKWTHDLADDLLFCRICSFLNPSFLQMTLPELVRLSAIRVPLKNSAQF
jgi:hypothetical protein